MSFNRAEIARHVAHFGAVTRVVIARVRGSSPREPGASMLVWPGGQTGTIGGGALEYEAAKRARDEDFVAEIPLGPNLGQCCGGAVTLVAETWTAERLDQLGTSALRRVSGTSECPLPLAKASRNTRSGAADADIMFRDGWLFEPECRTQQDLWIYGAGHVGRAVVNVMAPLPNLAITWVDTGLERFPKHTPPNVIALPVANPADAVPLAPASAAHLVLTYSHALDLELCHRLLGHGFTHAGLIGSKTKWARFQKRLLALGHTATHISRITCPIGDPTMGKHPQQIALSVAQQLGQNWARHPRPLEMTA